MKKNNMLRIASVLLVAVLLSTCAISGAFAKYYTDGEAGDTARVAAFGIEVTATGNNVFLAAYPADDSKNAANGDPIANSVASANGTDKVIAPGTSGDLGSFGISGTAEVAVEVKKVATLNLTNWGTYCPIVITFDNGTPGDTSDDVTFSGLDPQYADVDAFKTAVEAAISGTVNYAPNATLNETSAYTWAWAFDGDDEKDTALGRLLADVDPSNDPEIELNVEITVTQIN